MDIPTRVARRAAEAVIARNDGCLVSTYSVASHGYAQIGWQENGMRFMTTAHRAAWVHGHGQIPEGMTVDHLCKNRKCVSLGHLRLLTNFENARRTFGRDWPEGSCRNGHPNTLLRKTPSGRTRRVPCVADYQRAHRARKKLRF